MHNIDTPLRPSAAACHFRFRRLMTAAFLMDQPLIHSRLPGHHLQVGRRRLSLRLNLVPGQTGSAFRQW